MRFLNPKTDQSEPPIAHAFDIANRAGLTPEEEDAQFRREVWIGMQRDILKKVKQAGQAELAEGLAEGLEKGLKKGLKKGLAEGEYRAKLLIARNLLDILDDATIASKTGLKEAEVNRLR